ncbi:hypothetical protein CPB85DRAFT_1429830 [Mucidula mucida]|nr:hypothetical protein CPB85DRAFT_1429830 [Mucidula mucida]
MVQPPPSFDRAPPLLRTLNIYFNGRSADDSGPTTRASKAAKTDNGTSPATKGKKGGKRGGVKVCAFPSTKKLMLKCAGQLVGIQLQIKGLPLHVNITHTPPSIPDDESVPAASADPGFISSVALTAATFSTGSYGWKGTKRFAVELPGDGDEKETVQVILNATVMGSKQAPSDAEDEAKVDETKEEEAKEEEAKEDEAKED